MKTDPDFFVTFNARINECISAAMRAGQASLRDWDDLSVLTVQIATLHTQRMEVVEWVRLGSRVELIVLETTLTKASTLHEFAEILAIIKRKLDIHTFRKRCFRSHDPRNLADALLKILEESGPALEDLCKQSLGGLGNNPSWKDLASIRISCPTGGESEHRCLMLMDSILLDRIRSLPDEASESQLREIKELGEPGMESYGICRTRIGQLLEQRRASGQVANSDVGTTFPGYMQGSLPSLADIA